MGGSDAENRKNPSDQGTPLPHQPPLVGDQTYGRRSIPSHLAKPILDALKGFKRQALHAALLGFIHPETGKQMEFTSPLPDDMKKLLMVIEGHAG